MNYYFYDTSAILYYKDRIINEIDNIYNNAEDCENTQILLPMTAFYEIQSLIGNNREDLIIENKYQRLLSQLSYYSYMYEVYPLEEDNFDSLQAYCCGKSSNITYYTNKYTIYLQKTDKNINKIMVGDFPKTKDDYCGYVELNLCTNEDIEYLYEDIEKNLNGYHLPLLKENEYLILRDYRDIDEHHIIPNVIAPVLDIFKWHNNKFERIIRDQCFNSDYFGETKPKDVYQSIAMDSLLNNTITLLGGQAGVGKSFLALGYLFDQLQKHKLDRIVLFCNPVGAKNAAKLGYYPGSMLEKVLSTQIGNILISKIGDISEVNRLINEGIIQLIPVVDARGYEVPSNSGVYVAEAQNLTSDLLRLVLQRCGENNVKVIVDGDREEQLDMEIYEQDNGMQKMSQVFRGSPLFGQVDMKNIYRSEIAKLAQQMR